MIIKNLVLMLSFLCLFSVSQVEPRSDFLPENELAGYLQCGNTKFCPKNFQPYRQIQTNKYKYMRFVAEEIIKLMENGVVGMSNTSSIIELIEHHRELCRMDTIGFLLDENVGDYQISCVWAGSSQYGECVPVPPQYSRESFSYIKGEEWVKKLENVKDQLKCGFGPKENYIFLNVSDADDMAYQAATKNRVESNAEFFICNERCDQGGIGYAAAMLILISLTISFFKNCLINV